MAVKKISELNRATEVTDNDWLVIVQDGETKKVQANKFVKVGDEVPSAQTLGGYGAEEFIKTGETASDSEKLGGISADQYVTKSEQGGGGSVSTSLWWLPVPYLLDDTNYQEEGYRECDGSRLSIQQYPELYAILGRKFCIQSDDNTVFRLPDLRGRSLVGRAIQKTGQTAIPTEAGRFVNADSWDSEITVLSGDEHAKEAVDGQNIMLGAGQLPPHRHSNGINSAANENGALPYGYSTDYTGGSRTIYRVQTDTGESQYMVQGVTGDGIFPHDTTFATDNKNKRVSYYDNEDNLIGQNPVSIVAPSFTVKWIMKVRP